MEEECRFDRTPLSGNKDKFSFTMSHKKMLGYVWNGCDCHVNVSWRVFGEESMLTSSCGVLWWLWSHVAISSISIRANSRTSHCECQAQPRITPLLSCGFPFSSKTLKPQTNSSVFGSLQNLKEDKTKPVKDEYEYVSDEGELKIDEFPIRRKKNTVKRDQSCECFSVFKMSARAGFQTSAPSGNLFKFSAFFIFWLTEITTLNRHNSSIIMKNCSQQ